MIDKLALFQSDLCLGEQRPEDVQTWRPQFGSCGDVEFKVADEVWKAFRKATPEWFYALSTWPELTVFPFMASCLSRVLRELPDRVTGLTWTQMQLLEAIKKGARTPRRIFAGLYSRCEKSPLGYWAQGHLLCGLATCGRSAVAGIDERAFTLGLHDDADRFRQFMEAPIGLSAFGRRLLERSDDFARHNRVDFWWGGCRIENENLWRWDDEALQLVAPT